MPEFCDEIDEIRHPIVREALRLLDIDEPVEISTFSDIPANSGLGSSSAFAVGILHALYALKGEMRSKNALATEAAMLDIQRQTIHKGYDRRTCWVHARAGMIPGEVAGTGDPFTVVLRSAIAVLLQLSCRRLC